MTTTHKPWCLQGRTPPSGECSCTPSYSVPQADTTPNPRPFAPFKAFVATRENGRMIDVTLTKRQNGYLDACPALILPADPGSVTDLTAAVRKAITSMVDCNEEKEPMLSVYAAEAVMAALGFKAKERGKR